MHGFSYLRLAAWLAGPTAAARWIIGAIGIYGYLLLVVAVTVGSVIVGYDAMFGDGKPRTGDEARILLLVLPVAHLCVLLTALPFIDMYGRLEQPRNGCSSGVCGHGTHVAGIAAGASGMAPKAEIASVQLFSYTDAGLATAFVGDLTNALNAVGGRANPTTNNAIVVNVGMHGYKPNGEGWSAACDGYNTAFGNVAEAVKKLHDVGIAVIAPTGNKGLNGSIAFPACLSRVVKVAAADNAAGYTTAPARWARSNLASAIAYSLTLYTPALWLAPGAHVPSAWPGGGTAALSGTSQAAPHVAGMYAALKAVQPDWSVTQLNEYVRASASAAVKINLPTVTGPNPPQNLVEFRYVLLPN